MKYLISWAAARRKYLIMNDVNKFLFLNAENLHNLKYVFIALNRIRHWQYKQTNEMNCFCSLRTPITCFEINTHTHTEKTIMHRAHVILLRCEFVTCSHSNFFLFISHMFPHSHDSQLQFRYYSFPIFTQRKYRTTTTTTLNVSPSVCVFVLFVALRNDNFFLSSTYYKYKFCQFWTWCGSLFRCLFLPHFIYFGRYRTR